MHRFFLICCFLVVRIILFGQGNIVVSGRIRDHFLPAKSLPGVVQVFKEGQKIEDVHCGINGRYQLTFVPGFVYDIAFAMEGYHTKNLQVDARNIPEDVLIDGFELELQGRLFEFMPEFDTDILREPVAVMKYNQKEKLFAPDQNFSERRSSEIEEEIKRVQRIQTDPIGERARFDKLVLEGDGYMGSVVYDKAIEKYDAALSIFTKDLVVREKLARALSAKDLNDKSKHTDSLYRVAMNNGFSFFTDEDWNDATVEYKNALIYKPGDHLAQDMIYLIELLVNGSETDSEYQLWISRADIQFKMKNWLDALQFYQIAQQIHPEQIYPADQIAIINGILNPVLATTPSRIEGTTSDSIFDKIPLEPIYREWFDDETRFFVHAHVLDYQYNVRLVEDLKSAYLLMLKQFNDRGMQLIHDNMDIAQSAKDGQLHNVQDMQLKMYRDIKDHQLRLLKSYRDLRDCAVRADLEMKLNLTRQLQLRNNLRDLAMLDVYRSANLKTIDLAKSYLSLIHERMSALSELSSTESWNGIVFKRELLDAYRDLAEHHIVAMGKRIEENLTQLQEFHAEHISLEDSNIVEAYRNVQLKKMAISEYPSIDSATGEKEPTITKKEFKIGNKEITEYRIEKDDEVQVYKSVLTDNTVYYFQNNKNITPETWQQALASFND